MELGVDYTIRELAASDKLKKFSTGDAAFQALKTFLVKQASNYHESNIARTYVAVKLRPVQDAGAEFEEDPECNVLGYVTLSCSEIDIRNGYSVEDCPHANRYDSLPAVKIARLATDQNYRKKGIGEEFVALAIAIAADQIASLIGCRFVITDAKPQAVSFYERVGFTMLDTEENKTGDTPVMFIDLLHLQ